MSAERVRAVFHDEAGAVLLQEVEQGERRWVRRPDGNGGYVASAEGVRRVLWNLPALLQHLSKGAHAGPVYLTEGTSDALALTAYLDREGLPGVVTTNPFGALSWREEFTETLTGAAEVVAIVDVDGAGVKRAALLTRELEPVVDRLSILTTPLDHKGADLRDHLAAGLTLADLIPLPGGQPEDYSPVIPPPLLGELLDGIELFTRRFVVLDEAQATASTLWAAHTWAIEAAYATPYLFANSAEAESGKTRLLEVLREVVRAPLFTMNVSDAALFRAIDARKPTLFFDEVDSVFSPRARERGTKDDLRALLNAGYRRGQEVLRMGGGSHTELQTFQVFGAKALAGLGSLPPTLASRCLRIELKRRRLDEPVADFFPDEVAEEAAHLRARLEDWAEAAIEGLKAARPERIDGLRDRSNEVWRPLLAIAELAGETWAARARRAALLLAGADDNETSLGILLLENARDVFEERQAERIATADLIRHLAGFEESPWGEWWLDKDGEPSKAPRRLAQLLHPYGIRSTDVRAPERKAKGYKREDFLDAWERFLPPRMEGRQGRQRRQPAPHGQTDVADVADVADRREGPASRFCDECTTPERCAAEVWCQQIPRLTVVTDGHDRGR